jgi:hypothetical protein
MIYINTYIINIFKDCARSSHTNPGQERRSPKPGMSMLG